MSETDYNEQFELVHSVVLTASNIMAHVCPSYPLPLAPIGGRWRVWHMQANSIIA